MPTSLDRALREEPDRFIAYAYRVNPNINDFRSFVNALKQGFDTPTGRNASSKHFNDHETKTLFESEANKDRIRRNVSEKEFKEIFENVEDYEVQRAVPKGEYASKSDIKVVHVPRKISVNNYVAKSGAIVRRYDRGYSKWNNSELHFLKVRKERKLARKDIINEYNQHFKMKRSESSLTSRIYRL